MPGYVPLHRRNPDLAPDTATKAKYLRAKLRALVGEKPDIGQIMLIRSLVPLYLQLEMWRLSFEAGQPLNPDFAKLQSQLRQGLNQLLGAKGARPASDAPSVADVVLELEREGGGE